MDRTPVDKSQDQELTMFALLGELRADVRHILSGLADGKADIETLRGEIRRDTDNLRKRLDAVEKFNTRVIAYASVVVPLLMVAVQIVVPRFL